MPFGSNLDVLQNLAAAFEEQGIAALDRFFDPEIEWHEDPSFPESGVYRGIDAVTAYSRQFLGEFSEIHYEVLDAIERDDRVVANLKIHGVGRASGVPFELSAWWAAVLRGGKLIRCFAYLDRRRALEAVGLADAH
ncbi:MAG TPA: nuclear transport factor 2 family protein [Solirubrobacterales bacterium]|nr:nuclear transport factor 2 family protein [Solirubrobacterales bacterium]